jgi:protein-S-isoprenylcysteine O-methyltransferase Ste14
MLIRHSRLFLILRITKNIVGVGIYLLLLGLFIEGLTILLHRWISFPIPFTFKTKILLSAPCLTLCLLGMIWFHCSLNLIKVHLSNGKNELIIHGPFAYVRHPLYSNLIITIPPLVIVWFGDLLFFIPWILIILVSHFIVSIEERGLINAFGEDYKRYRKYVPALLPYKGAIGKHLRRN